MSAERKKPSRLCDACGKTYYRANRVRAWTIRAPGQRAGWFKTDAKMCMGCQTVEDTKRMLTYVDARWVKRRESPLTVLKAMERKQLASKP